MKHVCFAFKTNTANFCWMLIISIDTMSLWVCTDENIWNLIPTGELIWTLTSKNIFLKNLEQLDIQALPDCNAIGENNNILLLVNCYPSFQFILSIFGIIHWTLPYFHSIHIFSIARSIAQFHRWVALKFWQSSFLGSY